jgi:twitching motility protein PilT
MDYKKELEELILNVIHENGSDLHLGAGRVPVIRVAGELVFLVKHTVLTPEDMWGFLNEMLGQNGTEAFKQNKEADFSYDFRGEARLRGNAFFQKGLVNLVFRLVPKVQTMDELRLPKILSEIARKKQGFFLVVGPVGQGKSTTLSSMIDIINNEQARNIITIEDPIEHVYTPNKSIINQREVGIDTIDFHIALKEVFREDVNVIMVERCVHRRRSLPQ